MELKGMRELMQKVEKMGKGAKRAEKKAVKVAGEYFAEKLKENTPKSLINKDHAADNILVVENKDGVSIGFHQDHFYMMFVEFGTSKISPNPFMARTFDNEINEIQKRMASVINKELKT